MQKKESYKYILPHFQLPGQAYFVTWCLKEAIPAKVIKKYSKKLEILRSQMDFAEKHESSHFNEIKKQYYILRKKYFDAFDADLNTTDQHKTNLSKPRNLLILKEALEFW